MLAAKALLRGHCKASPLYVSRRCLTKLTEKDTIVKLLYNIGSREEVEQYLELFSSVDSPKFAVIKIGGAVLDEELDVLTSSLTFLHKVGLYPIVLHGAGPQLNKQLEKAGIEPIYHEGIRVTDPRTLEIARRVFYSENLRLVEALESLGTRARPVIGGTFIADYLDRPRYNLVGKITGVNVAPIESAIRTGALPILTSLAETPDGQILNVNADVAASELAKVIQPLKVVYLSGQGGLYNGDTNEKIDVINLDEEFDRLMQQPWVKYGTKLKIREINDLLIHLPRNASVSVTDASNLSRELFTHKGAGTLLRRGNKLTKHTSLEGLDTQIVTSLLGSNLVSGNFTSENLIAQLKGTKYRIYTDADYQGIAIVTEPTQPNHIPVLQVFSVTQAGQLSNFRDNLWENVYADYKQLCWTTDRHAEIKNYFFDRTEGSYSLSDTTVFWYGLDSLDAAKICVSQLLSSPSHSKSPAPGKLSVGTNYIPTRSYSAIAGSPLRVGLIGARGYVGKEFMRILQKHPNIQLACVSSRELAGKPVEGFEGLSYSSLSPQDCATMTNVNCWVLALPNNLAKAYVDALEAPSPSKRVLVDFSADYRFDSKWVYGMPEINRDKIINATLISNPGCYATGAQLSLRPISKEIGLSGIPNIFGVSGYSGAGTTPSDKNNPAVLADNLIPYALTGHMHEGEVSHHLGHKVHFMPHVAPFFQGITLTVSIPLSRPSTVDELERIYKSAYGHERLIRLSKAVPLVKANSEKHHVAIGGYHISKDGQHAVVVCTLDNLLKGAATQAIQNINLAFGLPELQGIDAFLE